MFLRPHNVARRAFLDRSKNLLGGLVAAPLGFTALPVGAASEESGPLRVVQEFYAAYAELDMERLLALLTDDCFFEDPTFHLVARGKPEIRKMAASVQQVFSDVRIEIENRIACRDWVVTQQRLSAVYRSRRSGDAAGRNISVRGATIFGVRKSRISRWVDYYDYATYRKQLGLKTDA